MKILVFAHRLEIGGTQVNAIELSAALRDLHGHDIVLFATPGPMLQMAADKGLRFIAAPDAVHHPSWRRMSALREAVRAERPDLIHAWDWPQCLDAFYGATLPLRTPLAVTDMSMVMTRLMPKAVPTTFGTPELVEQARRRGRSPVELLLPPVDVHANSPVAVDAGPFRRRHGLDADQLTIVTVSRLTDWMKAESLRRTVDAVRTLGRRCPIRFLIVGDGPARGRLEEAAAQANAELGRPAIVLTGPIVDPRVAYASADIVVGMGGSALRGMAFAKPVLVVGEQGFCAPFDPQTAEDFYWRGIYGLGDGDPDNARMVEALRALVDRRDAHAGLGEFARRFVVERFSLEAMAARLSHFLCAARERPPIRTSASDGLRTSSLLIGRRLVPEAVLQRLRAARQAHA